MVLSLFVAFGLLWAAPQTAPGPDRYAALVAAVERAAAAGDRQAIRTLGREPSTLAEFANALTVPAPERIVIKERDRTALPEGGHRLLLEVFWQRGIEARVGTWTLDVLEDAAALRVAAATRLAHVAGLYRLSLDPARQFEVRNLTVRGPDLSLHVPSGSAFVATTHDGITAVVLLGRGEMRFAPEDAAERTQVRLFSGAETLAEPFEAAFVRLRPEDFTTRFDAASLVERPVDAAVWRRANAVFEEYVGRTLQINLAELSGDRWSITPQPGDMIAEIRTNRFGTLTYTRSHNDAEDVTLFDRRRRRNISVYASAEKLASRGRFYSEDDLVDYDITAYDVEVAISPERERIQGAAHLRVRINAPSVSTLNLRLAENLVVSGVYSAEAGRLLHLRVVNQNSLIVSLPATMVRGSELSLRITYAGPLLPQQLDREAIAVRQDVTESLPIPPEPRFLYSNRAYWYPQSVISDYATVKLGITVPAGFHVAATGVRASSAQAAAAPATAVARGHQRFAFESTRPVRYLACVISRLRDIGTVTATRAGTGPPLQIALLANPRQSGRARDMGARTAEIYGFYTSVVGDAPYPEFSVVFTERELPGGHSPAYFAVVDQPSQGLAAWRNDPVNFDNYPEFFIAHELAHQWWGQAIGWKNYHEQWLSEGFAQYFAALYAERKLAAGIATNVFRRMRETAMSQSSQGPVYLGYRLGHVKADPKVFRAVLYNKGAMVLHMLRRMVGDEAFFRGIREFYAEWKYRKAGTNDLQATMERVSGRDLSRFFEAWIFGIAVPSARFSHRVEGTRLTLRLEQGDGAIEFPVTIRVTYASGRSDEVVMVASGPITEQVVELKDRLRSVTANADHGTLAVIR